MRSVQRVASAFSVSSFPRSCVVGFIDAPEPCDFQCSMQFHHGRVDRAAYSDTRGSCCSLVWFLRSSSLSAPFTKYYDALLCVSTPCRSADAVSCSRGPSRFSFQEFLHSLTCGCGWALVPLRCSADERQFFVGVPRQLLLWSTVIQTHGTRARVKQEEQVTIFGPSVRISLLVSNVILADMFTRRNERTRTSAMYGVHSTSAKNCIDFAMCIPTTCGGR